MFSVIARGHAQCQKGYQERNGAEYGTKRLEKESKRTKKYIKRIHGKDYRGFQKWVLRDILNTISVAEKYHARKQGLEPW